MKSVLVPIDDSSDVEWAVRSVIDMHQSQAISVHLLNVQPPLSKYVSRFINRNELDTYHLENGMRALQPVIDKLNAAGVSHTNHVVVGSKAESIAQFSRDHHCQQIVLPKSKETFHFGLGSIGSQLRHLMGAEGSCDISEVH